METLFWLVVIYYVGRRWLKRNPEKKARLREYAHQFIGDMTGTKTAAPSRKESERRMVGQQTARVQPSTPSAGAPKPQPGTTHRKKAEKQFQEL